MDSYVNYKRSRQVKNYVLVKPLGVLKTEVKRSSELVVCQRFDFQINASLEHMVEL